MRIGIPRALLYYKYFPLWSTFLTELGQDVVLSDVTNRDTIKCGVEQADNDVCVPVKVFYGHVLEFKNKVDAIFIPRVVSTEEKTYTCPKFMGLPDMIEALEQDMPPVISPSFNLRLGFREYYGAFRELSRKFSDSSFKFLKAYSRAHQALNKHHHQLLKGFVSYEQASSGSQAQKPEASDYKIGVLGHPYNIYDPFISMNLIERLKRKGIKVITNEMVSPKVVRREEASLPKTLFWSYEKEIIGTAFNWLRTRKVDGIIYVLSFACGPDSLIQVLIEQEGKMNEDIPIMSLVIDEHSAETGLVTRLEAFIDMLTRRKKASLN